MNSFFNDSLLRRYCLFAGGFSLLFLLLHAVSVGDDWGRDFLIFWYNAQKIVNGQVATLYAESAGHLQHYFATGEVMESHENPFPYPPHALLFFAPFGLLSFAWSYAIWTLLGLASFVWVMYLPRVAALYKPSGSVPWFWRSRWLWVLLSPLALHTLIIGQTAFFMTALLLGGLAYRNHRPVVAGICFGVLTLKPHLGLLIPALLLWERNGRAFFAAALTFFVLAGVSVALWGAELWFAYFEHTAWFSQLIEGGNGSQRFYIISFFGSFRAMGVEILSAYALHIILWVALLLYVLRCHGYRLPRQEPHRLLLFLFLTLLTPPYVMTYDMLLLLPVIWMMLARLLPSTRAALLVLAALTLLPQVSPSIALGSGVAVAPWVLVMVLFYFQSVGKWDGWPEREE